MESNETLCEKNRDCLFVAGDGLFKVWHVILIAAAILILILVIVLRFIKCPRLPEEARKKKELERRREESGENGATTTLQQDLNNTDGHVVPHVRSPYEGNVDQPLDQPGNVDLPLTPPQTQDVNVVHNPSAVYKPPPVARFSRHSHEPSDSVELRYIRSRTTSEVRSELRDSYYRENTFVDSSSPTHPQLNDNQFQPVMSTSTRI